MSLRRKLTCLAAGWLLAHLLSTAPLATARATTASVIWFDWTLFALTMSTLACGVVLLLVSHRRATI